MAGLPIPERMDGNSLLPILNDPGTDSAGVALTSMFGSISATDGRFRITRYEDGSYELFDVSNDPENADNLADSPRHLDLFLSMKEFLGDAARDWGIAFDDEKLWLIAESEHGRTAYFLTASSDISELTGSAPGVVDEVFSNADVFTMPAWAENFLSSTRPKAETGIEVRGTAFDNIITASPEQDVVRALRGNDAIFAARGSDTVFGGGGNDTVMADAGDDVVSGDHGNDSLDGGRDRDLLLGGKGRDTLFGGIGDDTLTGGAGRDEFQIRFAFEGTDVITDYARGVDGPVLVSGATWEELSISPDGEDCLVRFDGKEVRFVGVGQLGQEDFLFS